MAASKIIDKISVGAIHSVDRAGSQLRFYKYSAPGAAQGFRSRLPFVTISLNNLRGVSIWDSYSEYVTAFHYNAPGGKPLEERIWWPYRYDNYTDVPRRFSEWRDETDAQILEVLEIVRTAENERMAKELK